MAAVFGEGKIFLKIANSTWSDTLLLDNFDEIALFGKNSKIQKRGNFFENC